MILVIGFILCIIPSVLIIVMLRRRRREDALYLKSCSNALARGLLSIIPIIGASAAFAITLGLLQKGPLKDVDILVTSALHKFIVLALAEELVKFLLFRGLLKKKLEPYSWADVTALMVIIGAAFGLAEDIPYAIGASVPIMVVRGVTMGHVGYGFIMGWFYGKRLHTGDKKYGVLALLVPFLIHGLYDYSLTPELLEANEWAAVIAVSLAVLDVVLVILMIRFFRRARKSEVYNEPLPAVD